ncbi:hypothetical protein SNEBB_007507 [Seison nebaliae]|nr:hypothetical protein SNEBB_007507 [Seison nebaliae]
MDTNGLIDLKYRNDEEYVVEGEPHKEYFASFLGALCIVLVIVIPFLEDSSRCGNRKNCCSPITRLFRRCKKKRFDMESSHSLRICYGVDNLAFDSNRTQQKKDCVQSFDDMGKELSVATIPSLLIKNQCKSDEYDKRIRRHNNRKESIYDVDTPLVKKMRTEEQHYVEQLNYVDQYLFVDQMEKSTDKSKGTIRTKKKSIFMNIVDPNSLKGSNRLKRMFMTEKKREELEKKRMNILKKLEKVRNNLESVRERQNNGNYNSIIEKLNKTQADAMEERNNYDEFLHQLRNFTMNDLLTDSPSTLSTSSLSERGTKNNFIIGESLKNLNDPSKFDENFDMLLMENKPW